MILLQSLRLPVKGLSLYKYLILLQLISRIIHTLCTLRFCPDPEGRRLFPHILLLQIDVDLQHRRPAPDISRKAQRPKRILRAHPHHLPGKRFLIPDLARCLLRQ